jgi:UDP-GlcNAc:undecaprenyl-phosphate/decaprenyl-phosphate GlcNAc-1-phosphate transferase
MSGPVWISFAMALLVALMLTPVLRHLALRFGFLDHPNQRSSHSRPTPRSGGVAIVTAIVIASCIGGAFESSMISTIIATMSVITLMSVADDIRGLSGILKLILQISAATVLSFSLTVRALDLPFFGVSLGVIAIPFTVVWLVSITNAFNFMDGLNGIASTLAVVAGLHLAALFGRQGDVAGTVVALSVAGAAAGFLPWNFPGGSIFMGDTGSASLGFILGALVVRASVGGAGFVAAVLVLSAFLVDTGVTLLRRARRGERLLIAHRTHFYQRLNQSGWPHVAVTGLWTLFAIVSSAAGLSYVRGTGYVRLVIIVGIVMMYAITFAIITRRNRELSDGARQPSLPDA